jgi:hypothetical protein
MTTINPTIEAGLNALDEAILRGQPKQFTRFTRTGGRQGVASGYRPRVAGRPWQ